jgi:hypothetical protein
MTPDQFQRETVFSLSGNYFFVKKVRQYLKLFFDGIFSRNHNFLEKSIDVTLSKEIPHINHPILVLTYVYQRSTGTNIITVKTIHTFALQSKYEKILMKITKSLKKS